MPTFQNTMLRNIATIAFAQEPGMKKAIFDLIKDGEHGAVRVFLFSAVRLFSIDQRLHPMDAATCVGWMEQAFNCKIDFVHLTSPR